MTTAIEYGLMADECFQWARAAKTQSVRSAYLEIAKVWLEAAAARQGRQLPIHSHHIDVDAA